MAPRWASLQSMSTSVNMALSTRQEGLKQVPWFSLAEWHRVYEQIYSDDANEQTESYNTMLAWKARIPKLPIGIDCTLSVLQVCIRDREWTPKIATNQLPLNYENDLRLMYSTTIMRLLNHISNIGHTKQTSLFQIAKKINIPEWIVNLRHDTAHGYELPNLSLLRIAINILLAWLHEEYWAPEAKKLEERAVSQLEYTEIEESQDIGAKRLECLASQLEFRETEETQDIGDLIELWTSVNLHIYAGYNLVSSVPDPELKDTLQDLRSHTVSLLSKINKIDDIENDKEDYVKIANDDMRSHAVSLLNKINKMDTEKEVNMDYIKTVDNDIIRDDEFTLETGKIVLLSEISRYLNKKSISNKNNLICTSLLASEAFLPNEDVLSIFNRNQDKNENKEILPSDLITFWKDIIFLLYEKDSLETLIMKLIDLVYNEQIDKQKRLLASLWINTLASSFLRLDIAHRISRVLEYRLDRNLLRKGFENRVKEEVDRTYPDLKSVFWFNLSDMVLSCFTDRKFVLRILLNVNEFSVKFIGPILELASPGISEDDKRKLLDLVNIYKMSTGETDKESSCETIFTLTDLRMKNEENVAHPVVDEGVENNYLRFTTELVSSEIDVGDKRSLLDLTNIYAMEKIGKESSKTVTLEDVRIENERSKLEDNVARPVADERVRNNCWKLANATHNWFECPIGMLPWQDSMGFINPIETIIEKHDARTLEFEITPGIIDRCDLRMQSQINWDNVLRKKKRLSKRQERRHANIINKAIEAAKKRK